MPTFLLFFLWRKMFWSYFWWKIIFPTINNMYNFFKKKHFSILGKINDLGHFEQIVAQKDFFLVPRDLVWLHFHTFFKKHISEILSADIAQNTNLEQRSTGKQHYWSGYLVDTLLFSVSCHIFSLGPFVRLHRVLWLLGKQLRLLLFIHKGLFIYLLNNWSKEY